ncbi:MAG: hypothetical protein SFX74_05490, partial [Fimbriimonadaceae bacterium]|nr:hypothetical protein [Fimbriimonadaceae bacterium]
AVILGCESSNDQNAPVSTKAEPTKVGTDPAKEALLPTMTATARAKKDSKWAQLTDAEKDPFVKFHDGDAKQAENHFESLARTEREEQIN